MYKSLQMAFPQRGSAFIHLAMWNRPVAERVGRLFRRIEQTRKADFKASLRANEIDFTDAPTLDVLPSSQTGTKDPGLRKILCWISESDTYFTCFQFDASVCETDYCQRCQFIFLANIITRCKGEAHPVKVTTIWGAEFTTNTQLALSILSFSRCKGGGISRMLIDMIQDGELK